MYICWNLVEGGWGYYCGGGSCWRAFAASNTFFLEPNDLPTGANSARVCGKTLNLFGGLLEDGGKLAALPPCKGLIDRTNWDDELSSSPGPNPN